MQNVTVKNFFCVLLLSKAYTSVSKASLGLADHKELGKMMNTIIFHTKMVDSLVEMLVETSDLSIFWWDTQISPVHNSGMMWNICIFLLFFFLTFHVLCFCVQLLQPCVWEDVSAVLGASLAEPTLHLFPSALHTFHVLYTRALSRGGKRTHAYRNPVSKIFFVTKEIGIRGP